METVLLPIQISRQVQMTTIFQLQIYFNIKCDILVICNIPYGKRP